MKTQTIECEKCTRPLEFTLAEIKEMPKPIEVKCIFCASKENKKDVK